MMVVYGNFSGKYLATQKNAASICVHCGRKMVHALGYNNVKTIEVSPLAKRISDLLRMPQEEV